MPERAELVAPIHLLAVICWLIVSTGSWGDYVESLKEPSHKLFRVRPVYWQTGAPLHDCHVRKSNVSVSGLGLLQVG
jgi:hypothetical protein